MMMKRKTTSYIVLVLLLVIANQSIAGMYDLTLTDPNKVQINDAWFYNSDAASTGSGVIQPFLRIQKKGIEQGYNTNYRPAQYPEMTDPWTKALLMSDVPTVDLGGTLYREFLLDLNQNNSATGRYISLDALEIYLGEAGDLTGHPSGLGTLIYDLDDGGDNWILLDATLNSGSGSGDMFAYILDSLFDTELYEGPEYVYLYSMFGVHNSANATFEEWAVRVLEEPPPPPPPPPPVVPAPTAVILGIIGLGISGLNLRRFA